MTDYVHVSRLRGHPANVRESLGDLAELAASIRVHGILQPVVVQPHPTERNAYEILAGHRRVAAARQAGMDEIPVEVRQRAQGHANAIEIMLVENCQRADLGPVEKAEAMGALRQSGMTAAKIAERTGLSGSTVSYYLSLLELSAASLEKIRAGEMAAATGVQAVRQTRATRRKREGTPKMGAEWEPDFLNGTHPLARKANALCEAREHTMRRRVGKVACGQCWETVIRQDERLVGATAVKFIEPAAVAS
jgi:ParB family chromosome partitioning protein